MTPQMASKVKVVMDVFKKCGYIDIVPLVYVEKLDEEDEFYIRIPRMNTDLGVNYYEVINTMHDLQINIYAIYI